MVAIVPEVLDLPVRRSKLRPPRLGGGLVPRPRLTARLDRSLEVPFTLISAPAGFGKTTLLVDWCGSVNVASAWLTLDAGDRQLGRFVSNVVAAIDAFVPDLGALVPDLIRRPHTVPADEIGAVLADHLFDLPRDAVLVLDDFHVAASADLERFLSGLLQAAPPSFHLVLATRRDPALPLARLRLQGRLNELRAADLRFDESETAALLRAAGYAAETPSSIAVLHQQTGGWIAGLRLALLALPAVDDRSRLSEVMAGEQHLMDFLVEEVLSAQPVAIQDFLLRTAMVDRVSAPLADALLTTALPGGSAMVLQRLVRDTLVLETADDDGDWFSYHPLLRSLLRHQIGIRLSAADAADLHQRAGDWFAAHGFVEPALHHRIAAGDMVGAATLVEEAVPGALDGEDWNAVAGWLELLPEALVHARPGLLLAKAWVSNFSGRSVPVRAMFAELDPLLTVMDDPDARAVFAAERDALAFGALSSSGRDPDTATRLAHSGVARQPYRHRLAAGLAIFGLGCALQTAGRTEDAVRWLTETSELSEERIDAGSIRALGGLVFVHRQAGNFRACEDVARHGLALAERHGLPVAAGWLGWILGWFAYERDDLGAASAHFTAIAADHRRVHFHCACEAMVGLVLAYHARGMGAEAAATLRRLLELILDANALEYLPLFRCFEARLALLQGDRQRAIDWLAMDELIGIESNSFDAFDHPLVTRVKLLLAEGSGRSLARARRDLETLRTFAATRHHQAHQIEILALTAIAHEATGQADDALAALRAAISLAEPVGFVRTFVELGEGIAPPLRRLAAQDGAGPFAARLLLLSAGTGASSEDPTATVSDRELSIMELLTARELEVLGCLARRLSYQEIGEALFISLPTVKSHASNIYGKLGAGNRREALAKAQSMGWTPQPAKALS